MNVSPLAVACSVGAMLCFGVTWFLAAKVSRAVGALRSLFLFQLSGLPFLALLLPWAPAGNWGVSAPAGLAALGCVNMLLYFHASRIGNMSIVSPVAEAYVLVSVLLGVLILGEQVSSLRAAGIAAILAGVIAVSVDVDALRKSGGNPVFRGAGSAFLAALGNGVYFFWASIASRAQGWFQVTLGIRAAMTIMLGAVLWARHAGIQRRSVPWTWLIPAACGDVLGFSLFNLAVNYGDVSYVTAIVSGQAVVTVLLSGYFFGERLRPYQFVGLVLVVGGLAAAQC